MMKAGLCLSISVEVRPLASKVGAKHLAKSSSPFAGMILSKGKVFLQNQEGKDFIRLDHRGRINSFISANPSRVRKRFHSLS